MAAVEPTTARQLALYEDTCDIWKPNAITFTGANGEPNDTSYTKVATSQKCFFFTKTEVASPESIGRMGQDIIFTLDWVKFPSATEVDDTYILKVTTADHPLINTFWRVEGEAQRRPSRARRKADFALVYTKKLPQAPSGVS